MTSLAQFMEDALYGSEGYYSAGQARTGRGGDYFTAPETGAVFGQLLGNIFRQWRARLAANPFRLIEVGGGEGGLMQALLASPGLSADLPERTGTGRAMENCVRPVSLDGTGKQAPSPMAIERSRTRRNKLRALNLPIQIHSDFSEVKNATLEGILFANELIDAFPVHRVRMNQGHLEEAFVSDHTGGRAQGTGRALSWCAPSTPRLAAYFERLKIQLPDGYETEVNLAMADWLRAAAAVLKRGLIVLIDYGRPAWDYYAEERAQGTLRGFKDHRVLSVSELLAAGAQADWTADVDFTSLALNAIAVGLEPLAFMEMGTFLKLGVKGEELRVKGNDNHSSRFTLHPPFSAALKYLLHPDGLGTQFHVLVLGKNVNASEWTFEHDRLARLGLPK